MARERHVGVTVQRGCDYKIRVGRDGGHHRERYFMSVVKAPTMNECEEARGLRSFAFQKDSNYSKNLLERSV